MARGEGFGLIVGQGVRRMKEMFAEQLGPTRSSCTTSAWRSRGSSTPSTCPRSRWRSRAATRSTNKGPQHDEAWLIFMDMVNNQIPTFEDKAEALHYFPLFRTWFGLMGLCKLPWNDIEPADNAQHRRAGQGARARARTTCELYAGITGQRGDDRGQLIAQSERRLQLPARLQPADGHRARASSDWPPYRSVGPVTKEEYESRAERYDKQLKELIGVDPAGKSTEEKMALHREWREDRYKKLCDAVYKRRGWTDNAHPDAGDAEEVQDRFPGGGGGGGAAFDVGIEESGVRIRASRAGPGG